MTRAGVGVDENRFDKRAILAVAAAGLVCALLAVGAAYAALAYQEPRFRAETQVALLPARNTPPEDLSDYWEALSRGQAARVSAEVLGQRRWIAPAARAAGVPASSITLTAGAVAETTLIDVALEAGSPIAAESALNSVIREARPVVEAVSGPFALEVVQSADGSAEELGVAASQLFAVAGAAGLLVGSGLALMTLRHRMRRRALASSSAGSTSSGPESGGPTTSSGPTSSGPTSSGPTSSGPTSSGPTSSGGKPPSGGKPSGAVGGEPPARPGATTQMPANRPARPSPHERHPSTVDGNGNGNGAEKARTPPPEPRTETVPAGPGVPGATFGRDRHTAPPNRGVPRDRPGNAHASR